MVHGEAWQLNSEAGRHEVTLDERELEAVRRASDRSWNEFPYYEARFGERGRRFSFSDGAWIATLCAAGAARALEQIRWLGAVLSSRGMPQILLERHLMFLHEELDSPRYRHLLLGSLELERLRQSFIDQPVFVRLAAGFENRVEGIAPFRGLGLVLVSAVCDEALGIENAVASVVSWADDRERFPRKWIDAIGPAITSARARLASR